MINKIALTIETAAFWIYGITSAISILTLVLYECNIISFTVPMFAGTTIGIALMWIAIIAWWVLPAKFTAPEKQFTSMFTIPLSDFNRFIAIAIGMVPTFMILSFFWKKKDWFSGPVLLCIASIVNVFIIMLACRATVRLTHALKYDYNTENCTMNEFLERYPEEYKYIRPIFIPIEFLENHPEIAKKINPKNLPQKYKDKHNIQ